MVKLIKVQVYWGSGGMVDATDLKFVLLIKGVGSIPILNIFILIKFLKIL